MTLSMNPRRKRALRVIIGVAVVLAIVLWLLPVGLRLGAEKYLADRGFSAEIEDVDLNLFTGELAVTGAEAETADGDGFALGRFRVNVDYWPLFRRHFIIHSLEVADSRIDVQRTGDGALRVAGFALPVAPQEPAAEQEADKTPWGFGLETAQIDALTLRYREPGLERSITFNSSTTQDLATWRPERSIPLDARVAVGDARFDVSGSLAPFGDRVVGELRVGIVDFQLGVVAPFARKAGMAALAGVIGSDVRIQLDYAGDSGLDLDVAGHVDGVGEDDVIPDPAVVGHVGVGHDEAVAPHPCDPRGRRAPVQGRVLADRGAGADLQRALLAVVLEVLGIGAHRGAVVDLAVLADAGGPLQQRVGPHLHPVGQAHLRPDDGERTHAHRVRQLGVGVHDGRGVADARLQPRQGGAHRSMTRASSFASVTTWPSTRPTPCIRHTRPRNWIISSSNTRLSPGITGRRNFTSSSDIR